VEASQADISLFAALATAAQLCMDDFNPPELALTAEVFAWMNSLSAFHCTAGQLETAGQKLFAALAKAAVRHMDDFNPENIAMMAETYAVKRKI